MDTEPCEFACRSHDPHDGTSVEILRADPVIWVSAAFMTGAVLGGMPSVVLSRHGESELLTITGRNRTVVYRIGRYDPTRHSYLCHWPD